MSTEICYAEEGEEQEEENWITGYTIVESDNECIENEDEMKNLPDDELPTEVKIDEDEDLKEDSTITNPPKFEEVWLIHNESLEFLPEDELTEIELGYFREEDFPGMSSSDNSSASESSDEESKLDSSDEQYSPSNSEDETESEYSDDFLEKEY